MRKRYAVKRLALASVLAALYVVLCLIDVTLGRFKLTFAASVIIFASLVLPFPDCMFSCLVGVFLDQVFSPYGLSVTTVIWMIPPLLRPLIISPVSRYYHKRGVNMEDKKVLTVLLLCFSSLLVTLANSLALYLDSIILDYPYQIVIVDNVLQALITQATTVVECFLIFPLIKALRKAKVLNLETEKRELVKEGEKDGKR